MKRWIVMTSWTVAMAASLAGTAGDSTSTSPAAPATFQLVGTHPQAIRQRTATGQTLRILFPWNGRLFSGYGDYGANTGPISISPFDPATNSFSQTWVSDTESIENFRVIRGRLYAPAIDPRAKADYAMGEPWADFMPVGMTHSYDMVTLDGNDLWLVGSRGSAASAWRSQDDGKTWKVMRNQGPSHGLNGDFARFYFAGVLDKRLYLQAIDFSGGAHPNSVVFDGARWLEGPNLLPEGGMGWRPVLFAGQMVYRSDEYGGRLISFDGEVVRYVPNQIALATTIEDETFYMVRTAYNAERRQYDEPRVIRTKDLANWEMLTTTAPTDTHAIGWLDGRLYLGTAGARLFRLDGEPAWQPTTMRWNQTPSVKITKPLSGTVLAAPADVAIDVETNDPDGQVVRVLYWNGSTRLGDVNGPPFGITWTAVQSGTYRIDAHALDDAGGGAWDRVWITVTAGSGVPTGVPTARPTSVLTPIATPIGGPRRTYLPITWTYR